MTTRGFNVCSVLTVFMASSLAFSVHTECVGQSNMLDAYNVVWDSPSSGPSGSMPLGNGDIGVNAWIDPSGDLVFYISKTDSWGDNGRLLKVGRIHVQLEPSPLGAGVPFRQLLSLREGMMMVNYGKPDHLVKLMLWVDANHPVIHIEVNSLRPLTATAEIQRWRTEPYALPSIEVSDVYCDRSKPKSMHAPTVVEPDTVLSDQKDRIGWYHHNTKSVGPALTARIQGLEGFKRGDPLLDRTFGAIIMAPKGKRVDDTRLKSPMGTHHVFSVYVRTKHPASPSEWVAAMDRTITATEQQSFTSRHEAHRAWWSDFWNRSWIHVRRAKAGKVQPRIPANKHVLKIGVDQHGGSRFQGTIARVSLFDCALDSQQLQQLAENDRKKNLPDSEHLIRSWTGVSEKPMKTDMRALPDSLTIEAWINLDQKPDGGGRIVDKITPGGSDGMLFDTWPGNSLRLIVGNQLLAKKNCLKPNKWHHVTAVIDSQHDRYQLWLDGYLVQQITADGDDAMVVSRGYALQRFITACAGRGRYPIKFNGSIFTVPYTDQPGDGDYRRWGPGYWWQNTRLPYISMCASGDFEMMRPLFHMYADELMPLNVYRTRLYLGHDGAFIPECIYFWGDVFSETYGWTPFQKRGKDKLQTSGWHKWEWVSGPELVWMMFDYYDHTLDKKFLKDNLLPTAHTILTFFNEQYAEDSEGRMIMHPAQALETWWDCTNPMPELAGLYALTERLLDLPETLTTREQRLFWSGLRKKLPPLPLREVDGVRMLAPAERFANKRNIENPELYAVFPFRQIALGRPNIELGIEALHHRSNRGHAGWRQDDIFMAYLGLAEEARKNLVARAREHDRGSRFPAFWGPNYDWIPDQDHGSVLMKALQAMALQTDGDKIYVLPAWPEDWDVSFKLHAPKKTIIEVEYRDGRIQSLRVTPSSRRKDVDFGKRTVPDR